LPKCVVWAPGKSARYGLVMGSPFQIRPWSVNRIAVGGIGVRGRAYATRASIRKRERNYGLEIDPMAKPPKHVDGMEPPD
jgi:hypothetical protein